MRTAKPLRNQVGGAEPDMARRKQVDDVPVLTHLYRGNPRPFANRRKPKDQLGRPSRGTRLVFPRLLFPHHSLQF